MKSQTPKDVEAYLETLPDPARTTLRKVQATIRSLLPSEATEYISYGIPTFKFLGPLVAFAAFKNHCSFFPMNSALIETFKDDLVNYQTAKGTIRFPLDKPLPKSLLKKFVAARIADNTGGSKQ